MNNVCPRGSRCPSLDSPAGLGIHFHCLLLIKSRLHLRSRAAVNGTGNVIATVTRQRRETVPQSAQGGILLLLWCVCRLCGRCGFHYYLFFLRCLFSAPEALGLFISWCNGRWRRRPSLRVCFVLNAGSRQMERTCGILGIWQQKKRQVLFEHTVDGGVVGSRG